MPSTLGIVSSGVNDAALIVAVTDTFSRADSTTTLGTADTGQAWAAHVGTWGISTNRAYSVTAADGDLATVPYGSATQRVTATISAGMLGGRTMQLIARFSDASNWYVAIVGTGTTGVYKSVGGSASTVASNATTWANGDVCRFTVNGTSLIIAKNGSTVLSTTDSSLTSGTRAGFRWGSGSSLVRVDTFEVTAP